MVVAIIHHGILRAILKKRCLGQDAKNHFLCQPECVTIIKQDEPSI